MSGQINIKKALNNYWPWLHSFLHYVDHWSETAGFHQQLSISLITGEKGENWRTEMRKSNTGWQFVNEFWGFCHFILWKVAAFQSQQMLRIYIFLILLLKVLPQPEPNDELKLYRQGWIHTFQNEVSLKGGGTKDLRLSYILMVELMQP